MTFAFRRLLALLFVLAVSTLVPAAEWRRKANADVAVTPIGRAVLIDVLANDGVLGERLLLIATMKPKHGAVHILGNRAYYKPKPGFTGVDQFVYYAANRRGILAHADVLVAVGLGYRVRIEGQVVDSPISGARVEMSTGTHDFAAVADGQGRFAIEVASLNPDAFVIASAIGTSDSGAAVDFRSALGEMSRLVKEAGADAVLSPSENAQTNITNLSTAHYVLMEQANEGDPPLSDAQLRSLSDSTDPDRLLELAAIQRLVIDGGQLLPDNLVSAFELLNDAQALAEFKTSLPAGRLASAINEIDASPILAARFTPDQLKPTYALVIPGAPGTIRLNPGAMLLELEGTESHASSGMGRLINDLPNSAPSVRWEIDATGQLVVVPLIARPIERTVNDPSCRESPQRQVQESLTQLVLRRLIDGDAADHVQIAFTTQSEYVPRPDCSSPPTEVFHERLRYLAYDLRADRSNELRILAPPGRWALAYYSPERWNSGGPWGYEVYEFGSIAPSAETWHVGNGRLYVNQVGDRPTEYVRLQFDGAAASGLFAIATLVDGTRVVDYSPAVPADGSLTFSPTSLTALWRSGPDISRFPGDGYPETGFFVRLDPGGQGRNEFIDEQGQCSLGRGSFTWAVSNGEMSYVSTPEVPPGVRGTRRWVPLARSGARIYVIEELTFFPNPPLFAGGRDERANFWEPSTSASACGPIAPPLPPPPPPLPAGPQVICLGEPLPAGWLRTRVTSDLQNSRGIACPRISGRVSRAWRIESVQGKAPRSTMNVCLVNLDRALPPGWVVSEVLFDYSPCAECVLGDPSCLINSPDGARITNLAGPRPTDIVQMCYSQPSIRHAQDAGWTIGTPTSDRFFCERNYPPGALRASIRPPLRQ